MRTVFGSSFAHSSNSKHTNRSNDLSESNPKSLKSVVWQSNMESNGYRSRVASISFDSDTDTDGNCRMHFEVQVLEGPGNFRAWERDVQRVAKSLGVLSLVSASSVEEHILARPLRPIREQQGRLDQDVSCETMLVEEKVGVLEMFREDCDQFSFEVDQCCKQQRRLTKARHLLLKTIHPGFYDVFEASRYPSEIMKSITKLCKVPDSPGLALCLRVLERTSRTNYPNISENVDVVRILQLEVKDSKGTDGDDQIIVKILEILPDSFTDLVRKWRMESGSDPVFNQLDNLCGCLLIEELRLTAEAKIKESRSTLKTKKQNEETGRNLHKCQYCHKVGWHKEKNCWHKPLQKEKKLETEGDGSEEKVIAPTIGPAEERLQCIKFFASESLYTGVAIL